MKVAAIYARVSTQDQADHGTSLQTQEAACRTYAEQRGYAIVRSVAEDRSGATLDRPGLDELRDLAADGMFQSLICYQLDRLSRDETGINALLLKREFGERGVDLEFVTVQIEDTPTGRFQFSVLAAVAGLERAQIIERTRRGKIHKIRQGRVLGSNREPYGYRYIKGEGRYEIEEEEAEHVRDMFSWLNTEGLSLQQIANRLNAQGVPTKHRGRGWVGHNIGRIMHNSMYAGRWLWDKRAGDHQGDELLYVQVPPIVSEEDYECAQSRIQENRIFAARNTRHHYLLRGLLRCALCGYTLMAASSMRYGRLYTYYRCPARTHPDRILQRGQCALLSVRADKLDAALWERAARQLSDPDLIAGEIAPPDHQDEAGAERARVEHRLTRAQADQGKLLDLYLAGDIDRDTFTDRTRKAKDEEARAEAELAGLAARTAHSARHARNAGEWRSLIEKVASVVPDMDFEERRSLLVGLGLRMTVSPSEARVVEGLPLSTAISLPL